MEMRHSILRTMLVFNGGAARRGSGLVGLLKWHRMSDRRLLTVEDQMALVIERSHGRRGMCRARVDAFPTNYGMQLTY